MAQLVSFIGGLDLYTNPLLDTSRDGIVLRAVNVDSASYGAKNKRSGYITYLGTPDTSSITDLFSWKQDSGTQMFTYRASGSLLYYSFQGTGNWTQCGNGTITPGSHIGRTVLANTLLISQNAGTTRHTTNGTSFTDTSGAPAGEAVTQFQNRVYITGTSTTLFYSTTNDPTNWQTTGTSDSNSFTVPGAGRNNRIFKLNNRLLISKISRSLFKWDSFNLIDMASDMGMSSPYSFGSVEDNGMWINERGLFTSAGDQPQLVSNPIYRYFQNNNGSAIMGTSLENAPGAVHYYDYLCAVGSMTDDFTNETVDNAIIKYNFQKNEFLNWSFADFPTTLHAYKDLNNIPQLIFGNSNGQAFQYQGTATSDAGKPIESVLELLFDFGQPHMEKDWRILWGFFNPGCGAQISVATSNTFIKEAKKWQVIGPAKDGVVYHRFPYGERGRFLYVKITESSRTPAYTLYGFALDADVVPTQ